MTETVVQEQPKNNVIGKVFNESVDLVQVTIRGRRPHGAPKDTPPPEYVTVRPVFNSLEQLLSIVPAEQVLRVLTEEVINPVADEVTKEALTDKGLNPVIYETEFLNAFTPQRSITRKDLKAKIEEATRQLCELLTEFDISKLSESERHNVQNRALQLQLKIKELQAMLVKRTRKPRVVAA